LGQALLVHKTTHRFDVVTWGGSAGRCRDGCLLV
jgi:hypothetical protein